jgi:hypothetical protein
MSPTVKWLPPGSSAAAVFERSLKYSNGAIWLCGK